MTHRRQTDALDGRPTPSTPTRSQSLPFARRVYECWLQTAERTYHLTRCTRMSRGGHFAPHEEPELLAAGLTEFLRTVR
jgi:hypothetical protein